jgi:Zn finger protein HypA/HybF involved in hydrogenase expression
MHETIIAKQIIKEAEKKGNVISVLVEVGELAHIPMEELKETLTTMVNWRCDFVEKKGKIRCGCGYSGAPNVVEKGHDSTFFKCPKCGSVMPEIIDGDKIILKRIEVE